MPRIYLYLISDYLFKLLLIGDSGVGKSCLLLRFAVSATTVNMHYHQFMMYSLQNVNFALCNSSRMTHIQKVISVQLE